jgi:8-oxo-dGTP pyrophosphatase MutT (NUDIX family)
VETPSARERIDLDRLRRALRLAGVDPEVARGPMVPARRGAAAGVPPGTPWRDAAALAYVFAADGALRFPLTLRRDDLPEHRGQVSLPGGRPRPGEDLRATALREAGEEVGLPAVEPEWLGVLAPVTIPHTHTRLHVHVACGPDPRPLVPQPSEVARILFASLDDLVDPALRACAVRRIDGQQVSVPCFVLDGLEVWGATAIALQDLAHRLAAAGPLPGRYAGNRPGVVPG